MTTPEMMRTIELERPGAHRCLARSLVGVLSGLASALLAFGCQFGCQTKQNPAPDVAIPSALSVEVEIDGQGAGAIDAELLRRTPPDLVEATRKAWKLANLFPGKAVETKAVEIEEAGGTRHSLTHPGEPIEGRVAFFEVDAKGGARVALGTAAGLPQPGGPGAAGDQAASPPMVRRVHLTDPSAEKAELPPSPPPISLSVRLDGGPPKTWSSAGSKVQPILLGAEDGEGKRAAWPLRDIAREVSGSPDAVVVQVSGDNGQEAPIDAAAWGDDKKIPVLRANRRGLLKLTWLDPKFEPTEGEELREITKLNVLSHARKPAKVSRK